MRSRRTRSAGPALYPSHAANAIMENARLLPSSLFDFEFRICISMRRYTKTQQISTRPQSHGTLAEAFDPLVLLAPPVSLRVTRQNVSRTSRSAPGERAYGELECSFWNLCSSRSLSSFDFPKDTYSNLRHDSIFI